MNYGIHNFFYNKIQLRIYKIQLRYLNLQLILTSNFSCITNIYFLGV